MESELIKDSSLIIHTKSQTGDPKNKVYTLKNTMPDGSSNVFFSHVFNYLPHGLIVKQETGMGATTLELEAPRNSIIVEPLRVTAHRKSLKHNGAYYVGTPFEMDKRRKAPDVDTIRKYVSAKKGYKKIITVADSLHNVVKALGDEMVKDEYFLLIDEIDSFQLDATFREKMEYCIDIYKEHPEHLKAMLTATPIEFSDEYLSNQSKTIVQYEKVNRHKARLVFAKDDNVKGVCLKVISMLYEKHPGAKVMVAYNSVDGCYKLAKASWGFLNDTQSIKILCGSQNSDKADLKQYIGTLENDKLPADLNFVTSAYFTGFDIDEDYHLIIISDIGAYESTLSIGRIRQIAGRCRKQLLTETIIYNAHKKRSAKYYVTHKLKDLEDSAKNEIKSIECINHNFQNDAVFRDHILKIRRGIVSATSLHGYKFVRLLPNGEPLVSNLNIDAFMENQNAFNKLYNGSKKMGFELRKAHYDIISYTEIKGGKNTVEEESVNKKDRQLKIAIALNSIVTFSIEEIKDKIRSTDDNIIKTILSAYHKYSFYIDTSDLTTLFREALNECSDLRKFKPMLRRVRFQTMNPNDHFKHNATSIFREGENYTQEELLDSWNKVFTKSGLQHQIKGDKKHWVVDFTNLHFKTKRSKKTIKGLEDNSYIITSFDPTDAKTLRYRPVEDDFDHDRWLRDIGF